MGEHQLLAVMLGILFGCLSRGILLRTDFRQYPTYPQGRVIHVSFGFIASFIGSVFVPAVLEQNWTAVTFLGLAATQFRDVRKTERDTLSRIDEMELVKWGNPFIEGMSQSFESRNYLVMFAALITTFFSIFNIWAGLVTGIIMLIFVKVKMVEGKVIGSIATVTEGKRHFDGPFLYVDDILIKNVGLEMDRQVILERGVGAIVTPKSESASLTIAYMGQRQAMVHHVANVLGVYLDRGENPYLPLTKRDLKDGRIAVFIMPEERDFDQIKHVLENVPILDSSVRLPKEANKGK